MMKYFLLQKENTKKKNKRIKYMFNYQFGCKKKSWDPSKPNNMNCALPFYKKQNTKFNNVSSTTAMQSSQSLQIASNVFNKSQKASSITPNLNNLIIPYNNYSRMLNIDFATNTMTNNYEISKTSTYIYSVLKTPNTPLTSPETYIATIICNSLVSNIQITYHNDSYPSEMNTVIFSNTSNDNSQITITIPELVSNVTYTFIITAKYQNTLSKPNNSLTLQKSTYKEYQLVF